MDWFLFSNILDRKAKKDVIDIGKLNRLVIMGQRC